MPRRRPQLIVGLLLGILLVMPSRLSAQGQPTKDDVRVAVQRFYNWYVPFSVTAHGRPWMAALQHPGISFSPELVRALVQDSIAQARSGDELVGLDYDPLLNAQDACEHYTVRSVRQAGTRFVVTIGGGGGCDSSSAPRIVAELTAKHDSLVFVNFRDPAQPESDLLSTLRRLHSSERPR